MAVDPIPDGYHSVTPYLIVEGADRVIEFAKQALGAEETARFAMPDGSIGHAEFRIGDSVVMTSDATERWPAMPGVVHLYLDDCDGTYARALEAGAESVQEPADQFYGDRMAGVRDPAGNVWWLATHVEDVPPDELARRSQEWAAERS